MAPFFVLLSMEEALTQSVEKDKYHHLSNNPKRNDAEKRQ